jgi:hypothetical protein
MTEGFRVTELFAYLVVGPDGDEGVPAVHNGDGWMPLVAADAERLEHLRPYAQQVADVGRRPVSLVRFGVREEVETVRPSEASAARPGR